MSDVIISSVAFGDKITLAYLRRTMTNIQRYGAADLENLMDRITKNSIGLDGYFNKFFDETVTNYPPYNLIQVNNNESRLEIALAGFKKEEVNVYTEYGKLFVEGKKKIKRKDPSISIKDWLNDLSTEPGHLQTIMKSGMCHWKMDSLPSSWVK